MQYPRLEFITIIPSKPDLFLYNTSFQPAYRHACISHSTPFPLFSTHHNPAIRLHILPLHPNHFSEVLQISHQQFGRGYLDNAFLQKCYASESYLAWVAIAQGEVIGFSVTLIGTAREVAAELLEGQDAFLELFRDHDPIALRKTLAIKPANVNQQVGKQLMHVGMQVLEKQAQAIVGVVWDQAVPQMEKMYIPFGMKPVLRIPQYWAQDSLNKQYQCPHCGAPPCQCQAILFAKM